MALKIEVPGRPSGISEANRVRGEIQVGGANASVAMQPLSVRMAVSVDVSPSPNIETTTKPFGVLSAWGLGQGLTGTNTGSPAPV